MAKLVFKIYLSYSQLCIFHSSLSQPFNDWSDRNFSQGFSWRDGSASFRALVEDGEHQVNLFVEEPVPEIAENVVRAFRVPFDNVDGNIEIASISDSAPIEVPSGVYSLQVEFLKINQDGLPEVNVRLNRGNCSFEILKADEEVVIGDELDLEARPAT